MIKIVYYVIHINFLIKSTDSCCKLRRGQHETSRKICIKLRNIVKKLDLKKIKTENILADSRKLKCQEKSSPEFQWTDDDIQLLMEATQNLKVEKDYKGLNWELFLGLTLTVCS